MRNCLRCHKELIGRQQKFCSRRCTGRHITEQKSSKLREARKNNPFSDNTKKKMKISHTGLKQTEQSKLKISKNNARYWTGKKRNFGKDFRDKMSLLARQRVLKNLTFTNIGKNETQLLNEQEIKDNCKIIRQFKIKELGYVVDGYCKETNTVYEVYEKHHYRNEKAIEKDLKREQEICTILNCDFIIIWDLKEEKDIQ